MAACRALAQALVLVFVHEEPHVDVIGRDVVSLFHPDLGVAWHMC
jgi:hypothetical protein